jgi:hypothetical protein
VKTALLTVDADAGMSTIPARTNGTTAAAVSIRENGRAGRKGRSITRIPRFEQMMRTPCALTAASP